MPLICRDCLISALLCSCYLPVFSGPTKPTFQGKGSGYSFSTLGRGMLFLLFINDL